MSKRPMHVLRALLVIGVVAAIAGAASPAGHAKGISYHSLNKIQKRLISGSLAMSLTGATPTSQASGTETCGNGDDGGDEPDELRLSARQLLTRSRSRRRRAGGPGTTRPPGSNGCAENRGNNVKVNQTARTSPTRISQGRGQAQNETAIAIDPNNPNHVVASQNDYRRGDGNCYGRVLARRRQELERHHDPDGRSPAASGHSRASTGRRAATRRSPGTRRATPTSAASCSTAARGVSPNPDQSSAFYVFRSTRNNGASWNFPGRPSAFFDPAGTSGVLEDKQLHDGRRQPRQPVPGPHLRDLDAVRGRRHGVHLRGPLERLRRDFSAPVLVSADIPRCATRPSACRRRTGTATRTSSRSRSPAPTAPSTSRGPTTTTAVDGDDNRNQILLAKSTDGGQHVLRPGQGQRLLRPARLPHLPGRRRRPFRACVPEKGPSTNSVFRATNYPSGAVNPKNPNQVVVTFGSYINKHSNESNGCTPAGFSASTGSTLYTGVKTPGRATTTSSSASRTTAVRASPAGRRDPRNETTVNQDPGQATTDQFWQWAAFTKDGKLAVDYYDRQYGIGRDDGLLRLHAVRQQGPREVRHQARHVVVDAAADAVRRPERRPVLRRLHLAGHGRQRRVPDLVGHPRPRPVPLPGHRTPGTRRLSARQRRPTGCRRTTRTATWHECRSRRSRRDRDAGRRGAAQAAPVSGRPTSLFSLAPLGVNEGKERFEIEGRIWPGSRGSAVCERGELNPQLRLGRLS